MDRQKSLLLVVACLVLVRFGIVPLNEFVQEREQSIQQLKERQAKGEAVISEVERMMAQETEIDNKLGQAQSQFKIVSGVEQVQLEFQEIIEDKAHQTGVNIESLEWRESVKGVPSSSVLKLSYKAKLEELMRFHSDIKNLGHGIMTSDFEMTVKRQLLSRKRLGNVSGDISLRIFYLVDDE